MNTENGIKTIKTSESFIILGIVHLQIADSARFLLYIYLSGLPPNATLISNLKMNGMKKTSLRVCLIALLITVVNLNCSTGAKLLQAGSPLLSSLSSVPALSQFTNLLKTPGLDKLIGGVLKKPFTLLAPTNDALGGLGADALTSLSNPDNLTKLANLVKDHIIPGKLDAGALMQSGLKAASGKALDLGSLGSSALGSLISGDKFNIFPLNKLLGS